MRLALRRGRARSFGASERAANREYQRAADRAKVVERKGLDRCAAHDVVADDRAFAAGVQVPEPLFACADPAVFGKPFFVMRRVAGTASGV